MIGDTQSEMDKDLVAWIDTIPFSNPPRNLTRDFSDAVHMAEILKFYYPRYVELHNYVPASNLNMKRENWNTLNRKVLSKIDMKLSKDTIHHLANASPGAIEKLLSELRMRILSGGEETHKSKLKCNAEEEKIVDNSTGDDSRQSNDLDSKISHSDGNNEVHEFNSSRLPRFRGFFVVFSWITRFFRIWNIIDYCRLPRLGKHRRNALVDVATEQIEDVNDETVPRAIYTKLRQQLHEREEVICTLNHKLAYLESSVKLKDLRISNLTTQILQNAVDLDCSGKLQSIDGTRAKLRSRSHNFHESKAN